MKNKKRRILWKLYLPVSIIYLEFALQLHTTSSFTLRGAILTVLFSLAAGCLGAFICSIRGGRFFRASMSVTLLLITLLIGTQAVYYNMFKMFLSIYSITQAKGVLADFGWQAIQGISDSKVILFDMLAPFVLWLFLKKKISPDAPTAGERVSLLVVFALFQVTASVSVRTSTAGVMSVKYLYCDSFVPDLSVNYFGAVTTLRLDIQNLIRPKLDALSEVASDFVGNAPSLPARATPDVTPTPEPAPEATPEPADTGPNVLEIDFDALIANETDSGIIDMHEYFSSVEPTYKNDYTGMFEGKNLIWICAEGFSSLAMDETLTPTLCKLASEGFVFENFYNPVWYVSTSDGEYVALTGLLPKSGVWSFSKSSDNYMPFGFGNLLEPLGYTCMAYHNHTYTYYNRDKSHPNMGYDYYGVGNGLELENPNWWPESDVDLINASIGDYIGSEPFHVYYMTISGHMYYNFDGNMMSYRHMDEVEGLPYSSNARAYIACQMEFDLAVELLISELEQAGVLDDTVIVISGDHYPYGLELSEIEELYGGKIDTAFELYRSSLMIWSSSIDEPVYVDKICSSLDIMPTLANLFALDYDSRLVMGRDILSDSEGLVIFANRSFISEMGRYDASKDIFTPNEGAVYYDGYARDMLALVNDKFTYSAKILDNDYYAKVFKP